MATVTELIRRNECDLRDAKAYKAGFLSLVPGELYECQYSRESHLFICLDKDVWVAWRETWSKGRIKSISQKSIATHKSFDTTLLKAKRYLSYVTKDRDS